MAQTAMDAARSSAILNANLPVGAAGVPGSQLAALNAGAMKLKLTSTASSGSASGTELPNGGGYTTGGTAFSTQSTASSSGSNVTMPHTTAITWTNSSGSNWPIQSLEITDAAPIRVWFGQWNGAPVNVANGNTFQVAADAITAGGF